LLISTDFIKSHEETLAACDFFTVEVLTPTGLVTYYVLFFMHVGSRKIHIAGMTPEPDEDWMKQTAREVTMADWGFLSGFRYLLIDRDKKFTDSFVGILKSAGVEVSNLPARSPNLNAFAERWVRSVKSECLSRLIFFGEDALRSALDDYAEHYHGERNHQGKDNTILFPAADQKLGERDGIIECRERLGGLLKYYYRKTG